MDLKKENVYSQNGEDGILKQILEKLNINKGTLVEFGAWDGFQLSNVQNLFQNNKNFHIVFIESQVSRFQELVKKNQHPNIYCLNEFITFEENNLVKLLEGRIHGQLVVLSMDTDNNDLIIWKNNKSLKPIILVIEVVGWTELSSRRELYNELKRDGYSLVFVTANFIFVRDDYFQQLDVTYNDPDELFQKCRHIDFCQFRKEITQEEYDSFVKKYCYTDPEHWYQPCRTWLE